MLIDTKSSSVSPPARSTIKLLEKTPRLPTIPVELQQRIIEEVGQLPPDAFRFPAKTLHTLVSLSQVSTAFHSYTEPVLYRHVTITDTNVAQLAALDDTLYNGAFRPPQRPLASHIESFLMMPLLLAPDQTPHNVAAAQASLRSIIMWIAPYVRHIILCGNTIGIEGMCEILESMPALRTLGYRIDKGIAQFPRAPLVKRLILTVSGGFEKDDVVAAVALTSVEEIVLCLLDQSADTPLARLLRDLLLNCEHLRRIVLVPRTRYIWKSRTPGGLAKVPRFLCDLVDKPLTNDFEGIIRAVRVPATVLRVVPWSFNMVWNGACWTLETIPLEQWVRRREEP
ncbi:hypothetical protein FRB97_006342 [Tulasnella sp. 331]|nr:hypothetical protein FRB97_006342 [Tulasnella sp. 331]